EFRIEKNESADIDIRGGTISARTDWGALRLTITSNTRALALYEKPGEPEPSAIILVLPRIRPGLPRAASLTSLGADHAAMRPEEQGHSLFDLGLNRSTTRFCVRAAEPDLVAALESVAGQSWSDAMRSIGDKILRNNPVRVIETAIGRTEVRTPI